jgi:hypothetical protein
MKFLNTVPTVKIDPTIILTQLSAGFFFDPYNLIGDLMQGKDWPAQVRVLGWRLTQEKPKVKIDQPGKGVF